MRLSLLVLVSSALLASAFRVGQPVLSNRLHRQCSPVRMADEEVDKSEVRGTPHVRPPHPAYSRGHTVRCRALLLMGTAHALQAVL